MNALYQHIEYLLLHHDCVIVPHFGGFVAQERPARYVETEALFFPPVRLVRFNPDLTIGDGLLLNHVCSAYQYNESEGKRAIQSMVLQLRSQLLADGFVDFGSIGIFSQDEDGDIQFSACQAGTLTPSLYGFDAFSMARLSEKPQGRPKNKRRVVGSDSDEHKFITIKLNRKTLRNSIAVAAVLMLIAIFVVPMNLLRRHNVQMATVVPSKTLTMSKENTSKQVAKHDEVKVEINKQEELTQQQLQEAPASVAKQEPELEQTSKTVQYTIVFASNVKKDNAERYAEELSNKGIEDVRTLDNGRTVRVVAGHFENKSDAYELIRELHAMGSEFNDIWVLEL